MSVIGLQIEYLVNGQADSLALRKLVTALERAGDEHANFQKHLWPRVVAALEAEERRQFESEGAGPDRGGWAALSPGYAKWKEEHFPGQSILRRTDNLFHAMTNSSSTYALREDGVDELTFGSKGLPYAGMHQIGTRHMPDRPPVDLSADFEDDLQRALVEASREAIRESRLADFAEAP